MMKALGFTWFSHWNPTLQRRTHKAMKSSMAVWLFQDKMKS